MAPVSYEGISIDRLHAMIDDGDIVIFGKRDAETLQRVAAFFDVRHDDKNLIALQEMLSAWKAWRTLGAAGKAMLWIISGGLAVVAALASITGRWPWLVDTLLHLSGVPQGPAPK